MIEELVDYWKETACSGRRFHSEDEIALSRERLSLPAGRIPEPWFGVPSKAKIFYLSLNPGHKPNDQSAQEPWRTFCRDMMLENVSYERYSREAPPEAVSWFRRNHGDFADVTFPWICNLRLIAYPSPEKKDLGVFGQSPRLLPSSRRMMRLVHNYLVPQARAGEILLLVMRTPKSWGFEITTVDYWDGGFFLSRPLRVASISPTTRVGPKVAEKLREVGAL